jgi:MFS family permease
MTDVTTKPSSLPPPFESLSSRDQRRNFILGVANGAMFIAADAFIDAEMVLSWFLTQLNASNFWIGMIRPIRFGGWFLPQIFISGYMQSQPRKLPFYRWMTAVRSAALLSLVLMVTFVPTEWMLPSFLLILLAYSLGAGLSGISFMDIIGKVIPPHRRGTFFSLRMFWGGILGLGTSSLVGLILDEPDGLHFPLNYTLLFGLAFVALSVAMASWVWVKEPAEAVDPVRVHWTVQLKRGIGLLRDDLHYRTFVLARLALMLAGLAAPFYVVYAKVALNIPARMVGVYLTARTATSILSNLLWGRISDRQGNRKLIRITNAVGISIPVIALAIGRLGAGNPSLLPWLSYLYIAVFAASGAFGAGSTTGNMSYLLDIAPHTQRALYVGFTNTLFGIGVFTSSLGGLIVDWAGFTTLMAIAALFYVLALFLSLRMAEPRQ